MWQADLGRRVATGEFAAMLGPGDGNGNIGTGEFFLRYRGGPVLLAHLVDTLDPYSRVVVDGFITGFNAAMAKGAAEDRLPVEYVGLGVTSKPWTASDYVARTMLQNFNVGAGELMGSPAPREFKTCSLV